MSELSPAPSADEPPRPAIPSDTTSSHGQRAPVVARVVIFAAVAAAAAAGLWILVGKTLWSEYQTLRKETRATADSVPVGYVGLHYRRSYNDRPLNFHAEKDGRKLLFAAKGEGPKPEYYDVTEADIDVARLEGGFGRDSIPGVDHPIIDPPGAATGRALRASQPVFGVVLRDGPRAYPRDLIEKIEVVNDHDGPTPIVVISDRHRQQALLLDRTVRGAAVTFGTTGYLYDKQPVLYDRKTRSLWLPQGDQLVCVNGALKGDKLAPIPKLEPGLVTWGEWKAQHPGSSVLMGNDREKPIPTE
jgi:hypothetical protein